MPAFCDCDDADAANYPGNTEICDGQDNNCAGELNISGLGQGGWFSDDTRADGTGVNASGTNLISDTLTDDPEQTASGNSAFDAEILLDIPSDKRWDEVYQRLGVLPEEFISVPGGAQA